MGKRMADGTWRDDCLHKLRHGEPFVVMRGQDMLVPDVLVMWCVEAVKNGVPQSKVDEMLDTIEEMKKWQPRKIPD